MAREIKDVYTGADSKFGTGAADDFLFHHDGTDSNITNATGNTYILTTQATKKTIIDNGATNNQFAVDHDTGSIGVGTNTPAWAVHVYGDTAKTIMSEYNGATKCGIVGGLSYGFIGTWTTHPLRILVNNLYKVQVETNGDVTIPAAYSTIIGGTNTALYIDDTGKIGPFPSSIRFKENIRTYESASPIYSLNIKQFDYKEGPKNQIGLIAEDVQGIFPAAVKKAVYLKNGENWEQLDRTKVANIKQLEALPINTEIKTTILNKTNDTEQSITTEGIPATVKVMEQSIDLTTLIAPMLKAIQDLKKEVDALKAASLQEIMQASGVKEKTQSKIKKLLNIK